MYYSIERFAGDHVFCEDDSGVAHRFWRGDLPANAKEGDLFTALPEGGFAIDEKATHARRQRLLAKQKTLIQPYPNPLSKHTAHTTPKDDDR